jgi:pyruvate/2-oxoglutarate dehydrogenase complex dihydrolipoamide dehydrogenase (E3) component
MKSTKFEVIVLGGGKAGKSLAIDLGKQGVRAALIEASADMIGGSCINVACIPTKSFITSARVADMARHAGEFGVETGEVKVQWLNVRRRTEKIVTAMREMNLKNMTTPPGLELVLGSGRFLDSRTIEVRREGEAVGVFEADKIFINTGTRPALAAISGSETVQVYNSETIQRIDELPRHLIVIGGSYVGLEFAQMFRHLGSEVTILERGKQVLNHEDEDIARALETVLRDEGIEIHLNCSIEKVEPDPLGAAVIVSCTGESIRIPGSHLLFATGRRPNTENLNLNAAGVEVDARGYIKVNERLETTAAGIWALGDVNGGPQFTHVSFDDYRVVKANVFGDCSRTTSGRLVPFTLFTEPELARVGLTEKEAREQGKEIRVAKLPASGIPRAKTTGQTRGLIKAIIDSKTERILGCTILSHEAGEMLGAIQMTMVAGLPYTALRDAVLAHPTMVEGFGNLFAGV